MERGDDVMQRPPLTEAGAHHQRSSMRLGIVIQTFAQAGCVLLAFMLGLSWHLTEALPPGENVLAHLLRYDWRGVNVQTAETMAFVTLSLCELFRAFTVRSERVSIFRLGLLSNRWMLYAVGLSVALLLLVVNTPFLQPIFNTHFLSGREWLVVLGLAIIPAIAEEITKYFLRARDRRVIVA